MTDITLMGPRTVSVYNLNLDKDYRATLVDRVRELVGVNDYENNVKAKKTSWTIQGEKDLQPFIDRAGQAISDIPWLYHNQDRPFVLTNLWGVIYNRGDYTVRHNHLNSLFSFVYFLRVDLECNTPLVFDELNYQHYPVEDEVLFFPADLWHHVPVYTGDKERIVISGNVEEQFVQGGSQ